MLLLINYFGIYIDLAVLPSHILFNTRIIEAIQTLIQEVHEIIQYDSNKIKQKIVAIKSELQKELQENFAMRTSINNLSIRVGEFGRAIEREVLHFELNETIVDVANNITTICSKIKLDYIGIYIYIYIDSVYRTETSILEETTLKLGLCVKDEADNQQTEINLQLPNRVNIWANPIPLSYIMEVINKLSLLNVPPCDMSKIVNMTGYDLIIHMRNSGTKPGSANKNMAVSPNSREDLMLEFHDLISFSVFIDTEMYTSAKEINLNPIFTKLWLGYSPKKKKIITEYRKKLIFYNETSAKVLFLYISRKKREIFEFKLTNVIIITQRISKSLDLNMDGTPVEYSKSKNNMITLYSHSHSDFNTPKKNIIFHVKTDEKREFESKFTGGEFMRFLKNKEKYLFPEITEEYSIIIEKTKLEVDSPILLTIIPPICITNNLSKPINLLFTDLNERKTPEKRTPEDSNIRIKELTKYISYRKYRDLSKVKVAFSLTESEESILGSKYYDMNNLQEIRGEGNFIAMQSKKEEKYLIIIPKYTHIPFVNIKILSSFKLKNNTSESIFLNYIKKSSEIPPTGNLESLPMPFLSIHYFTLSVMSSEGKHYFSATLIVKDQRTLVAIKIGKNFQLYIVGVRKHKNDIYIDIDYALSITNLTKSIDIGVRDTPKDIYMNSKQPIPIKSLNLRNNLRRSKNLEITKSHELRNHLYSILKNCSIEVILRRGDIEFEHSISLDSMLSNKRYIVDILSPICECYSLNISGYECNGMQVRIEDNREYIVKIYNNSSVPISIKCMGDNNVNKIIIVQGGESQYLGEYQIVKEGDDKCLISVDGAQEKVIKLIINSTTTLSDELLTLTSRKLGNSYIYTFQDLLYKDPPLPLLKKRTLKLLLGITNLEIRSDLRMTCRRAMKNNLPINSIIAKFNRIDSDITLIEDDSKQRFELIFDFSIANINVIYIYIYIL